MKYLLVVFLAGVIFSCTPDKSAVVANESEANKTAVEAIADPTKGIGAIKNVTLNNPLDEARIKRGLEVYGMKCQSCHTLDDKRVVGPGWKDITKKRKPEWIMNMILNVDVMLEKDPEAQKLLELCLMRMPNQNVSVGDARDILEFMRQNDGEK
jgi:mono/diheme cytochrome c family protein